MSVQLLTGDCRAILPTLPERSIQCVVTSPPYHGLRAYGGDTGMIGLEPTIDEHIAALVDVFRGVWRVLRDDGTVWLNYGDRYAGSWGNQGRTDERGTQRPINGGMIQQVHDGRYPTDTRNTGTIRDEGIKPKDLIGLPWRIAFALQAEGWYLRSAIVWHKPNPMPESVTDRPTSAYENIFLLTKSARYYYDAAAIAEQCDPAQTAHNVRYAKPYSAYDERAGETGQPGNVNNVGIHARPGNPNGTRNARNVWTIPTQPFSDAHFAVFPPEIPRRCILAGTSDKGQCPACGAPWRRVVERNNPRASDEYRDAPFCPKDAVADNRHTSRGYRASGLAKPGWQKLPPATSTTLGWQPSCTCDAGDPIPQTILDPFAGAGTTLLVADRLGRNAVGIEVNPEYVAMAQRRITNDAPLFVELETA